MSILATVLAPDEVPEGPLSGREVDGFEPLGGCFGSDLWLCMKVGEGSVGCRCRCRGAPSSYKHWQRARARRTQNTQPTPWTGILHAHMHGIDVIWWGDVGGLARHGLAF